MSFELHKIRRDFPILSIQINGKPLVYFDNGATAQKPRVVIEKEAEFYRRSNSSIHRGIHTLSDRATEAYEKARQTVADFINAGSSREIVFTSGTTGSINGVAFSFGEKYIDQGDEILITEMEHHANLVPWQMLCERKGARLRVLPFNDKGELEVEKLPSLLNGRTRIMAVVHTSNSLGTVNPVKEMIRIAHERNVPVLVDGAQSIQHGHTDVQDLDCDFFVFSGHKCYAPNGIGILYGKEKWLEDLPPFQGGGDMVDRVSFEETTYNDLPFKFEAGTTNYVGAIVMGTALEYLEDIGLDEIKKWEEELRAHATEKFESIDTVKIFGTAEHKIPIFSFLLENIHPYDAGSLLDKLGIAVRTGTHCTQPVMQHYGITGTIRASMAFYNTKEEIDILHDGILRIREMLS